MADRTEFNPLQFVGFPFDKVGDSSGGSAPTIKDEGVSQGTATTLDFVGAGVTATVAGSTATITIDASGGSSLAPSYHLKERSSDTVTYSGINSTSSSTSDAGWTIVKLVTDTEPERTRTVHTATGTWDGRASHTYTTSIAYNI